MGAELNARDGIMEVGGGTSWLHATCNGFMSNADNGYYLAHWFRYYLIQPLRGLGFGGRTDANADPQ